MKSIEWMIFCIVTFKKNIIDILKRSNQLSFRFFALVELFLIHCSVCVSLHDGEIEEWFLYFHFPASHKDFFP